jgi:ATP-binding protein involved in chromosome partitioning
MRQIRTYRDVADPGAEDIIAQVVEQNDRLSTRLAHVRSIVVVASGKGGVGKSAVSANLAAALAAGGARVGAADADLNGPSLARMLGARGALRVDEDGVHPVAGAAGVRVMSMDLLLAADDAPLRWGAQGTADAHGMPAFLMQSTLEAGALREFLADTVWGALDFLVIDAPPGTDKLVRLLELLPRLDVLLLVTTPSEIARFVVAKSARLARDAGTATVALVANMTTHRCDACGHDSPLFEADGARRLSEATGLPVWAEIPFDARVAMLTDAGSPCVLHDDDAPAPAALRALAARLRDELARVGAAADAVQDVNDAGTQRPPGAPRDGSPSGGARNEETSR